MKPTAVQPDSSLTRVRLCLRQNWEQFTLLVLVNAFVGAMGGAERVVLPLLAQSDFGLASRTSILSFIVSFGVVKVAAKLFAGRRAGLLGRDTRLVVCG